MKRILKFQILILALAMGLFIVSGARHAIESFVWGWLVITFDFILLGVGWTLVFRKKLIALSVLIIVFKYAILGVIIYHVVKQSWLLPFWFAMGISSVVVAALMYGLTLGFYKDEEYKEE